MINNSLKDKIISKVKSKFDKINPCGFHKELYDGFTREGDTVVFWFNKKCGSTAIEVFNIHKLEKGE